MPAPRQASSRRARVPRPRGAGRMPALAALVALTIVLVVTLALTAFGGSGANQAAAGVTPPAAASIPAGPPTPSIIATAGSLRLQMPVQQSRVTAIGYHDSASGALALSPVGRQGNEGLLARLEHRIFGGGHGTPVYYQLGGGGTSALDVGAAPGTDVYSPVDGTVLGISDYVLNGKKSGVQIDIQPANAPTLVVSLSPLAQDPALTVGSALAAGTTRLGTIVDLAGVERQALARYTQDAGNHVTIEIHPAAITQLP